MSKSQTTGFKGHDLAVMQQALAKLSDAENLVYAASIALDDIPVEIATHEGANAGYPVSVAADQIGRAITILEAAIAKR